MPILIFPPGLVRAAVRVHGRREDDGRVRARVREGGLALVRALPALAAVVEGGSRAGAR